MSSRDWAIITAAAAVHGQLHRRSGWSPGDVANVLAQHWPKDDPTLPVAVNEEKPTSVVLDYTGPTPDGNLNPKDLQGFSPNRPFPVGHMAYQYTEKGVWGWCSTMGPPVRVAVTPYGGTHVWNVQWGHGDTFDSWPGNWLAVAAPGVRGTRPHTAMDIQQTGDFILPYAHWTGWSDIKWANKDPQDLPRQWTDAIGHDVGTRVTIEADDSVTIEQPDGTRRRFVPDPTKLVESPSFGKVLWIGQPVAVQCADGWVMIVYNAITQAKGKFQNPSYPSFGTLVTDRRDPEWGRHRWIYGNPIPGNSDCVSIALFVPPGAGELL